MDKIMRPVWAEIDLDIIANNINGFLVENENHLQYL